MLNIFCIVQIFHNSSRIACLKSERNMKDLLCAIAEEWIQWHYCCSNIQRHLVNNSILIWNSIEALPKIKVKNVMAGIVWNSNATNAFDVPSYKKKTKRNRDLKLKFDFFSSLTFSPYTTLYLKHATKVDLKEPF